MDVFNMTLTEYSMWRAASYPLSFISTMETMDAFLICLTDVPSGTGHSTWYCCWGARVDGTRALFIHDGTTVKTILYSSSDAFVSETISTMSADFLTDGTTNKVFSAADQEKLDSIVVEPTADIYVWSEDEEDWVNIGPIHTAMTPDHALDTDVHIQTGERTAWNSKAKVWTSASDPTTGSDTGDGINVKDIWINTNTGESFVCTANTAGAATWVPFGGSGGGDSEAPITGYSTFNGYSTGRVISHNLGTTGYDVMVTPIEDPAGQLGEVWVIKGENSCTVKNSGSATTTFDYRITLRVM